MTYAEMLGLDEEISDSKIMEMLKGKENVRIGDTEIKIVGLTHPLGDFGEIKPGF